jgi:type I restriction enzyme, S subunit
MNVDIRPELPDGWRWVKLGEVGRVVSGSTPNTGIAEYWNGEITWITPTDLGMLRGNRIIISARRITKAGYRACGTEIIPPGSVVLSSRAPIGHLAISDIPLCTNQGCKSFVPGQDVDSAFLYYALMRAVPDLQELGSGATFTEISKTQLEGFQIPHPALGEQKRIAEVLSKQMATLQRARVAAEAQLEAAQSPLRRLSSLCLQQP